MIKKYKRLKELKKFIPYEFDPKYVDADRITMHDVKVREKFPRGYNQPLRTIWIRTLVVLNTDEDKEESTIFIKKAVIDPSISRDSVKFKMSRHLFKDTAQKFESQIDAITDSLTKIKMFKFPKPPKPKPPKPKIPIKKFPNITQPQFPFLKNHTGPLTPAEIAAKYNFTAYNTELSHLFGMLKGLKNANVPKARPLQHMKKEMLQFDQAVDSQLTSIRNISDKKAIVKAASHVDSLNKEMQEMAQLWTVKHPKAQKVKEEFRRKMMEIDKQMDVLSGQLENIDKQQQEWAEKMKNHHKTLTGLLFMHKTRIDRLMEFNMKALNHIENLNHDINEIDKQQEEFEKQLQMHKHKMNSTRQSLSKQPSMEQIAIQNLRKKGQPLPEAVVRNQKVFKDSNSQLNKLFQMMEEQEKQNREDERLSKVREMEQKVMEEYKKQRTKEDIEFENQQRKYAQRYGKGLLNKNKSLGAEVKKVRKGRIWTKKGRVSKFLSSLDQILSKKLPDVIPKMPSAPESVRRLTHYVYTKTMPKMFQKAQKGVPRIHNKAGFQTAKVDKKMAIKRVPQMKKKISIKPRPNNAQIIRRPVPKPKFQSKTSLISSKKFPKPSNRIIPPQNNPHSSPYSMNPTQVTFNSPLEYQKHLILAKQAKTMSESNNQLNDLFARLNQMAGGPSRKLQDKKNDSKH